MGVRKFDVSYGYEEMTGSNVSLKTTTPTPGSPSSLSGTGFGVGEFELASVASATVVPDDTFTVQQAVNSLGFGWFHIKLSLLVGLCWMADSMEMTILSILGVSLQCEWNISKYQQALTTSVVFLGMMLSSTFWTQLSDRYGRKPALTLCGVLLVLYSLLSAVAPSFGWLLLLRALVGFAIGCVPQSVTLYAEFLPTKQRAKCVVLMDCFWALGACFEVALALAVSPNLGWRWLLGLSTAPLFIFATLAPWLPESARYHVSVGNTERAYRTLEQIARENKQPMLLGRLVVDGAPSAKGTVRSLLSPSLRRTTLLLWFIWMACAFCYYGLVLMSTELLAYKTTSNDSFIVDSEQFQSLETTDFMDLLWTTLAEFPGIFATIAIIERFGRKRTMALQFLLYSGCIFLLMSVKSRIYLTLVLFVGRGVIAGLFQAAYIYTPEVYPSALRSVGVGGCSTLARLGAMATPYVAQVMLQSSASSAIAIYSVCGVLAAFACLLLPYQHST